MKRSLYTLLMASALSLPAIAAHAAPRQFNIAPQPLSSALRELGRQGGIQIIFTPAVVGEKSARAVVGSLEPLDALKAVLAGTGLTYQASGGGYILREAGSEPVPSRGADTAGASAPVEDSAQLTEIIVTAARQTQNLQKVSAAVQVVDGAELRRQAVTNVSQVFQGTPSVQVTAQPGGFSVDIRGQGGDMPSGSTQGSVALEFDGVYTILSQSSTIGFFDVDRIEVLPGPQSTRYGPNADGGVVNVISKDPILGDHSGSGALTVGNFGLVRGEVAQNIALSDTLALRLSGAAIHRDAYVRPIGSDAVGQSVRAKLLFEPTDDLNLKLSYQYDHIGGTGPGVEPYTMTKVAPYASDSINDASNPWKLGDYSTNGTTSDSNTADITQQTLTAGLGYRLGAWGALDVISSYAKVTGDETACYAGGPPWIIGGDHTCYQYHQFAPFHQFSTEARLHSAPGAEILWNVGFYHFDYTRQTWSTANGNTTALGGTKNATTTNAVFAEVTYPVTDKARVVVGARQSYDKRELRPAGITTTYSRDLHHFDYRLGGEYDVTPDSMVYATVSTGYRPGGLTGYDTVTAQPYGFKSEVNTAFELGSKNRFLDNRLQINADVFYYKQDSYQNIDSYHGFIATGETTACSPGDPRPACSLPTFNLAAHSLGLETQVRFNPTRADTLGFNATWLDAKFDKSQGTCATIAAPTTAACWIGYNDQSNDALLFFDVAGAVQPHSPNFAATTTYRHTFTFASGASLAVGGDAFYSGGYWVHPVQDASKFGWQPAYWQGGLNTSFSPAEGPWSLSAYVRNVSNYAVKQSTLPITAISDPRTFGLTLSTKW
jgi:iron complex outermembrane receptor protein